MNQEETIKILAMISAFYGQGKADAKAMCKAWHLILQDYDFGVSQQAIVQFAKNDKRDYATFPSVGQIVAAIEKEKKLPRLIHNLASMGELYRNLPDRGKELITEVEFEQIRKMEYEDAIKRIKPNNKPLLEE